MDRDRLNEARFFTQSRPSDREALAASNRDATGIKDDFDNDGGVSEDDYLSSSVASSVFDYRALTEYEKQKIVQGHHNGGNG